MIYSAHLSLVKPMNTKHIELISEQLQINARSVANTVRLLEEGATIPFISRYRKELTGSLDETQISDINQLLKKLLEVDKRRESIINSIKKQGKLTDDLEGRLNSTYVLSELEDIYLPFKPKKKTKASVAKENGLEPLAQILMQQRELNIQKRAEEFIKGKVKTAEEALQGARYIIAEWISENNRARNAIRELFDKNAVISSKVQNEKEKDGAKYSDYFDWSEPLKTCPSHRFLAIRRGEEEGFLKVSILPDEEEAIDRLGSMFIKGLFEVSEQVKMSIVDGYKRLIAPSIENEFRAIYKEKADEEAIRVFSTNLRQLLMSAPLGQARVLALDPGYRTGCKIVCLDEQGNYLHNETIYPHPPKNETKTAIKKITSLISAYKIEAIAIGNGTAGRETENLIKRIKFDRDIKVFVVSESGASIYSASKTAREEFPEFDVTVRGAISIGRRLMDPLAELVKIDPKSIGVGQYQHDVDQVKLKNGLNEVVESCVNQVGVNLNTASKHLLTYVSGLGPTLGQKIVDYRKENGFFNSRDELKAVQGMGPKAFEQSAGFLRIHKPLNPLDNTAVHPESYFIVNKMAADLNINVADLIHSPEKRKQIDIRKYVTNEIGIPTLTDIMSELEKPGRDPRQKIQAFEFSKEVFSIEDLKPGQVLPGIVTNITNFGAFVDVGVKQDGLVHISQLSDKFIKDPNEVVHLHQYVKVKVLEVDIPRKRIQLSMKEANQD